MTTKTPTAVIRQWARERGIAVGDRGRLAPQVLEAYNLATASSETIKAAPKLASSRARRDKLLPGSLTVRPMPGATGIGRRVRARSS